MAQLPIQFSGDENHPHPRHTGRARLDMVLALSAIFISAVSLYVAIEHGRTERQLVAANSWPFLAISYRGGPDRASYDMSNEGVGPAKLERLQVLYRGEVVPDIDVLLERCCGFTAHPVDRQPEGSPPFHHSSVGNTVFRPGEELEVMSLRLSDSDNGLSSRFRRALGEITFRGCYCSVFDECWSSDFIDLTPKKVRSCAAGPSFNDQVMSSRLQH